MTITHITHNVPADRVDFLVAIAEGTGGTLVSKTVEDDGEFTLVFSFPEAADAPAPAPAPGPATLKAAKKTATVVAPAGQEPPWMPIAREELARDVREVPGDGNNPRIVEFHKSTRSGAEPDSVPWCSSFVNWCVQKAGLSGSGSKQARSWLGWGQPINDSRLGCIVVLERGPAPQGHVGFLVGTKPGFVTLLGGNQGDRVSIASFSSERVLGLRWPTT